MAVPRRADEPGSGAEPAPGHPMRILVVSPSLPYPPNHAQRLRTWHLVTRLAARHHVTLVTWSPVDAPPENLEAVRQSVQEAHVGPVASFRSDLPTRLGRHVRFFATTVPTYVQAMLEARGFDASGAGDEFVQRSVGDRHFDVVVLEDESMTAYPLPRFDAPVVVHRLNVFERAVGDVPIEHRLRRLAKPLEIRAWRRFEAGIGQVADHLIAPTPEAAAVVARISPDLPVDVVTSGVDLPMLSTKPSDGTDLAFVGWMGYPPNVDAVRWFVREVWPRVRRVAPETRFRIVGRAPSDVVRALHGDGVVVTGEVPDVVDALRGVRVAVVPLRGGMGIKTKTVECMGMGLPVVSTTVGAEGISASHPEGLLVHDDADSFARAVIETLRDPARADGLGDAARQFALRHFDWDRIAHGYEQILRDAVTRSRTDVAAAAG